MAGGLGWGGCLTLEYKYKQHEEKHKLKVKTKEKNPGPRMHHCGSRADYMPKSWNDGAPCFPTDIQVFPFSFCYDTGIISLFL